MDTTIAPTQDHERLSIYATALAARHYAEQNMQRWNPYTPAAAQAALELGIADQCLASYESLTPEDLTPANQLAEQGSAPTLYEDKVVIACASAYWIAITRHLPDEERDSSPLDTATIYDLPAYRMTAILNAASAYAAQMTITANTSTTREQERRAAYAALVIYYAMPDDDDDDHSAAHRDA